MALTRINNQALTNVTSAGLPADSVVQVKSYTMGDKVTHPSSDGNTENDVMSGTITPKSSSNDILVMVTIHSGGTDRYLTFYLYRDSTKIGLPSARGNRTPSFMTNASASDGASGDEYILDTVSKQYLDSPATTSQITYKITMNNTANDSRAFYINATHDDSNNTYTSIGQCKLTLMEIAR